MIPKKTNSVWEMKRMKRMKGKKKENENLSSDGRKLILGGGHIAMHLMGRVGVADTPTVAAKRKNGKYGNILWHPLAICHTHTHTQTHFAGGGKTFSLRSVA